MVKYNFLAVTFATAFLSGTIGITQSEAQTQSGIASVYSTKHGTKTASGKRLNDGALTAAHRSLPFGTKVRVTNKRNWSVGRCDHHRSGTVHSRAGYRSHDGRRQCDRHGLGHRSSLARTSLTHDELLQTSASALGLRYEKLIAVASALQIAILFLDHVCDADGKPNADGHQNGRGHQGEGVHRHPVTIVVLALGVFIFREIGDRRFVRSRAWHRPAPSAARRVARPEADDLTAIL